jgi:hypothetical protein
MPGFKKIKASKRVVEDAPKKIVMFKNMITHAAIDECNDDESIGEIFFFLCFFFTFNFLLYLISKTTSIAQRHLTQTMYRVTRTVSLSTRILMVS